ncbi:bifunctional [glutamate--ammonia ligase]-adenylyl-L-tyrosine phosphorylase/[glutamate--ammonia-ligase] adenylyltransferase [Nitrosospira briensis]|uniref:bifunctional [glutamate--ammonia ligase]-adenylyl-L-tyrosine phosphorylase/[glutamate--ammonia-ligase] adenylyltransferase n=1 Tax=Nitrosospira briensis TaxID=35799 RepID=UPI000568326A|nr:bifunctional [glutamate--ammonia ligase]-adenylyl-L-tyrosine phosphorylase/[glutamate--ammonia-ligase] adenylyltransferase [Nitrosospira briensis]
MHTDRSATEIIERILPFSRYAYRILESEPGLRTELKQNLQSPFLRKEMQAFLNTNAKAVNDEACLNSVLRSLRKRVMLRLAARDLGGLATLAEVMTSMTDLAELTIDFALERQQTWLADPDRYGQPRNTKNRIQEMLVIAMGKLGGCELNVSSDVDLIFVYPEDGETSGPRSISNHDFFARLGRKLIGSLNDITPDGYVFRVDMRLRPYGESGPLVMSFAMLEEYFISQGREWERYAWIKGRAIAGPRAERAVIIEQIAQPFVFRKYLDFGAYESMRDLHAQIRREVTRHEMHGDIKLGPGGIREIEFIAQLFQLIRGGRDADLRIRSTLATLALLREKQQLPDKTVLELTDAYRFLRNLEHRLQYLDDQQTQMLPETHTDQSLIAVSMGFSSYGEFLQRLDTHRCNVTRHFEDIFAAPRKPQTHHSFAWLWPERNDGGIEAEVATTQLVTMGFSSAEKIVRRLQEFHVSTRYRQLPQASKKRVDALIPALIEVAATLPPADTTLERLLQLLESVSRRAAYLALLLEYPQALERVAKLVSTSQWASEYLSRHPILLDELLNPADLQTAPDWSRVKSRLIQQLNEACGPAGNDIEQQMDVLRHFQHAQVFQLLAQDVEGLLPLETLSDYLTDLADLILDSVLGLAWSGLRKKHRDEPPAFGIIGYGKLGGKELGYASDLDIIFLYDDNHPDAAEIYARLSQRINSWLTSYTSAGLLYETDLRLRPNGSSGLLVSSVQAFDQYQRNHAWVWEHQALTRARFVAGDVHVGEAFERTRKEVLRQRRELESLKREVSAMRQKMLDAHPNSSGLFDVKHDRGGIIDVEFIVQYLVLGHACDHPELTNNIGNIALLRLAGKLGLIHEETAERALGAYREFRRIQHRLRLSGDSGLAGTPSTEGKSRKFARVEADYLKDGSFAVLRLWDEVFGTSHL